MWLKDLRQVSARIIHRPRLPSIEILWEASCAIPLRVWRTMIASIDCLEAVVVLGKDGDEKLEKHLGFCDTPIFIALQLMYVLD